MLSQLVCEVFREKYGRNLMFDFEIIVLQLRSEYGGYGYDGYDAVSASVIIWVPRC